MYKVIEDTNAQKMRDVARTIKPTGATGYHIAERSMPCTPAQKAGPFLKNFFPQKEVSVAELSTEDLINDLAGGHSGSGVARFKENLQALYPSFPELWSMKPPMVGNIASRPLDYMDTGRGGYPEPAKALASALARNQAAKSLQKAVASGGDAEAELLKYREQIFALMPEEVKKHYLAMATA
jgi:hypothetical protein